MTPETSPPTSAPPTADVAPVEDGAPTGAATQVIDVRDAEPAGAEPADTEEASAATVPDGTASALAEVSAAVGQLAEEAKRYHARAAQRESVIDRQHDELERLRRGERRGLLRPILTDVCRLRDDMLRQAEQLPPDFSAADTGELLRSYAESLGIALADNGVVDYEPAVDAAFEPRAQRAVGRAPCADPALVGRIAAVRKAGYLDVETNVPLARAEVLVYVEEVSS